LLLYNNGINSDAYSRADFAGFSIRQRVKVSLKEWLLARVDYAWTLTRSR
jgi:hypothetical protein